MSTTWIQYPAGGAGGVATYATLAAFPSTATDGSLAIALDTHILYEYNASAMAWQAIGAPGSALSVGAFSSTPTAQGLVITASALSLTAADDTHPGALTTGPQSIGGAKTFVNDISAPSVSILAPTAGAGELLFFTPQGVLTGINPQWLMGIPAGDNNFYLKLYDGSTLYTYFHVAANGIVSMPNGAYAGYFSSNALLPAQNSAFRLGNNESVGWRNFLNNADINITLDASNIFQVGAPIVAATSVTTPQLISTVATGTPPLVVASTTQVANLNVASAGASTNIGITDDTTTNASMFLTWVTAATGNLPAKVSSTKLAFNPSTGLVSTVGLNLSGLTASVAVFTDGSKNLVSNSITGTGNVVMSAGPTLTGTIAAASMTLTGSQVTSNADTAQGVVVRFNSSNPKLTMMINGRSGMSFHAYNLDAVSGTGVSGGTYNYTRTHAAWAMGDPADNGKFNIFVIPSGTAGNLAFTAVSAIASMTLDSSGNMVVTGTITASNYSGTNTGDVTLAAVGAVPNANGASLSGQVLTLQPADGTNPGVVTTAAQTFAGAKTFSSAPVLSSTTASQAVFTDGSKNLVSNAITGTGSVVMSASPTLTGVIGAASITLSGYYTVGQDRYVATNGSSHVISDGVSACIANIAAAGTIATSTITMPANPVNGQIVIITSNGTITTLTLSANAGQTITGAATTLTPTNSTRFIWVATDTNWYKA